jgi:hypothetical protein
VRTKTKLEAERVGKYMIRPVLALERLSFLESEGKVCYRSCEKGSAPETMDYLEFIARVTSHIPDKGQVMVRYYGLYANAHRGKVKKASLSVHRIVEEDHRRLPSKGWATMIRKVYEVDPMTCPHEAWPLHEDCEALPEVRGPDEDRRLYYGGFRCGPDYRSPEAWVCGGEAPALPCFYRSRPDGGRFGLYSWRQMMFP